MIVAMLERLYWWIIPRTLSTPPPRGKRWAWSVDGPIFRDPMDAGRHRGVGTDSPGCASGDPEGTEPVAPVRDLG